MTIYLDNQATTPVDPRVVEAMLPYFHEKFGNAASRSHSLGWDAEEAVEHARAQVAALIHADPRDVIFTSGATESNNLALKGIADMFRGKGRHILTTPIEHPSVLETLDVLGKRGYEVELLPCDKHGRIDPEDVAKAIREDTIMVSVMMANNEIGTVEPIREIGAIAHHAGAVFHSDATQGVGRVGLDVIADHVHLAALTAHKIYGPKGCGALYVRRKNPELRLPRRLHGGGHERGMRAGTLNVPGIVGFGKACEICREERETEVAHALKLRDQLLEDLRQGLGELLLNGHPEERIPGTLHITFPGVDSDALMMAMPDIAVSSGSACASGTLEPSHVLKSIGMRPEHTRASIRIGIGRFNTAEEIETVADQLIASVTRLKRK